MKKNFLIIAFLSLSMLAFSQEYTTTLKSNPVLEKIFPKYDFKKNEKKAKTILELPFWDDFSQNSYYPDINNWSDNQVYLNNTLAVKPPSFGVASFDAVDSAGKVYEYADYNENFYADTLTSQPINLNYPGDNTVYLSFYYQPQGLGDAPETADSLKLEFYAPDENTWTKIWSVEGTPLKDFKIVILPVNDDKFLKEGFRFRFVNIASFGSSTYPSLASNCDFWNIDYVYLNKNRNATDTVFHDIAFTSPLHSLLDVYEAVPWEHYKNSAKKALADKINISYRNNDNVTRLIERLDFNLKDLSGNSADQDWYAGTYTPAPFSDYDVSLSGQPFYFPANPDENTAFLLSAKITTDAFDTVQNNEISYKQNFEKYYAYDDGTAEAGYGIYGNGTKYGQVALKFSPLKSDYLTGADMYFTRSFQDASQKYFWIYIWKTDENGLPGDTIKTFEGIRPEYENELNEFHRYVFEEPVFIEGDFFIGWTQTTEDKLNIGFDFNRINNDKVFYNISGTWEPSQEQGSLMIRPLFGNISGDIPLPKTKKLIAYPNPSDNFIKFKLENSETGNMIISDIRGSEIMNKKISGNEKIYVGELTKGIYFVKIITAEGKIYNGKFVKN